jgi:hypothetical protein
MRVIVQATNDNANVAAVTYGPVVLSRQLRHHDAPRCPARTPVDLPHQHEQPRVHRHRERATVDLGPFHDAHGYNYTVYWSTSGGGSGGTTYKLVNAGNGLVLGVQNMSTADAAWRCSGATPAPPTTPGR